MTTNRLQTIATRQQQWFLRDVVFAGLVALASFVSVTSVAAAAEAANLRAEQQQVAR